MKCVIDSLKKRILGSKYLLGTFFVATGSIIAAFFSYLLQFILGRALSIEDFGSFNALLSLSYLIGVPAGVFGVSLIKHVAELSSNKENKKLTAVYWKLILLSFFIGITIFLFVFLLRGAISDKLKIYDYFAIAMFGVVMGGSFLGAVQSSYLQGLLRYKGFAFYSVLSSFFRFAFAAGAVFLGFKLSGAFGGMVVSVIFTFLAGFLLLRKNLTSFENIDLTEDYKRIMGFSVPVMFVQFGLMLLNNIDLIMVKKFFEPETAGYYAGVVTLGKIFLFGAGTVATVMFPTVSSVSTRGLNYNRMLLKFLVLQIVLVLAGVAIYSIFPSVLTKVFFGERFLTAVEYLPLFSVFIGLYVLINFLILFFLAVNKTSVFLLLVPGLVTQFTLISLNHTNLYKVIYADVLAGIITLVLLIIYYLIHYGRRTEKS